MHSYRKPLRINERDYALPNAQLCQFLNFKAYNPFICTSLFSHTLKLKKYEALLIYHYTDKLYNIYKPKRLRTVLKHKMTEILQSLNLCDIDKIYLHLWKYMQ